MLWFSLETNAPGFWTYGLHVDPAFFQTRDGVHIHYRTSSSQGTIQHLSIWRHSGQLNEHPAESRLRGFRAGDLIFYNMTTMVHQVEES